jgi:hypothetical protein
MRVDIERIFARLVTKAALIAGINHHYLLDDYASTVRKDV